MDIKDYLIDLYIEKYGHHINRDIAEGLVSEMAVTDGTSRDSGERWSYNDAKAIGDKLGISWDSIKLCEWYLVLNMMYSDYYRTAKKHGLTDAVFFGELALDWFTDVDADDNKTFNYFMI